MNLISNQFVLRLSIQLFKVIEYVRDCWGRSSFEIPCITGKDCSQHSPCSDKFVRMENCHRFKEDLHPASK